MKIINITQITDNKFLNLFKLKYDKISYFIASRRKYSDIAVNQLNHEYCDAVMIVPIIDMTKTVLIKQFRPAINDYIYEFPAGLVEPGENIKTTAKRELFKETGLEMKEIIRITNPMYTSAGMSDESLVIALVNAKGSATNTNILENENIEVLEIQISEISNFCRTHIVDIKTMLMSEIIHASLALDRIIKK